MDKVKCTYCDDLVLLPWLQELTQLVLQKTVLGFLGPVVQN